MKKRLLSLLLAVLVLATPALAYGGGTGDASYINSTELDRGFTYENAISYGSRGRVETFTLMNTPGSDVYPVVMACDTIYGGFTIAQMISYAESLGYNVVGAVNADFGDVYDVPNGMVVEDGVYKSSSEGTSNALAYIDGRAYIFARPEVELNFTDADSGYEYTVTHLNKMRTNSGAYLYSEYFSTVSTRTSGDGWFIRFEVVDGEDLTLGGSLELVVSEITTDGGSVSIGEDNLVLTAGAAAGLDSVLAGFEVGDRVTLDVECADERLADAEWVTGGGDILVSGGELTDSEGWDSTVTGANPRTAVGIKRDGTVVYYVMDGRSSMSVGSTMRELAEDMLSMGCVDVINLDGGGSTAMSLRMPGSDGFTVVNEPSDGSLRAVSSYILFVTDDAPSGRAERLYLRQDGAFVLAGSTISLSCTAADSALHTVAAPENVAVNAQRGTVSGMAYTAGQSAGTDTVTLRASGVSGTGTLHVIDTVDSLTVTDAESGETLTRLVVENGESVALSAAAKYLGREVLMDSGAVRYTIEGDIGSITSDGVFTASGAGSAEGKIAVECGGKSVEIGVQMAFEFSDMRGHWAAENVKSLYEAGIVTGISDTEFGPSMSMRRGDFVLMLYRAAGQPEAGAASGFNDVASGAYYADAVAWAVANGITDGKAEGIFAPGDTLTRQEGFTFLYRALRALGVSWTDGDMALLNNFADGAAVADWARTATATLIANGVVEGGSTGLNPSGSLTRAEMAKMLDSVV